MKKLLSLLFVVCLGFVACNDDTTPPSDAAVQEASVDAGVSDLSLVTDSAMVADQGYTADTVTQTD